MGRFDEAADGAEKETDKEFQAELDEIKGLDGDNLADLFPEPADRTAAVNMMAVIRKSTERNEVVTALKAFGAIASKKAVEALVAGSKVAKKVLLASLALVLLAGSSWAGDSMTFSEFLAQKASESKGFYSLTWKADGTAKHSGGAYVPINTLHSKDKKYDYADWGLGFEEPEGSAKPRFAVPIMLNVVDIGRRLFNFRLVKEHVRTTALPKTWVGVIMHPPTKLSRRGLKEYVFIQNLGVGISARFSSFLPDKEEKKP